MNKKWASEAGVFPCGMDGAYAIGAYAIVSQLQDVLMASDLFLVPVCRHSQHRGPCRSVDDKWHESEERKRCDLR